MSDQIQSLDVFRSPDGLLLPKRLIKESIDQHHRTDWEDPDRYARQKQKAIRYVAVRAAESDLTYDQVLSETCRVFHDELRSDPDLRAALDRVFEQKDSVVTTSDVVAEPEPIRNSNNELSPDGLAEQQLADLEYQRHCETYDP